MRERVFLVRCAAVRPDVDTQVSAVVTEHEPDVENMQRYAKQHGVMLTIDVEPIMLVAGNGLSDVAAWIDGVVNVDPKPVIERDRTSILIDEMTRGMRNQERRVNALADTVEKLVTIVSKGFGPPMTAREAYGAGSDAETLVGGPETVVQHVAGGVDWSKYAQPSVVQFRGRHEEHGASSVKEALSENLQPGANRVVPGNMALRGAPASSQMYGPGVDAEGNPGAPLALPKVGDTLKPKAIGED